MDGNLTLGIRSQVGHHFALFADIGQHAHNQVCQVETYGHVTLRLVCGIAEHHTLVTGTLFVLVAVVHTAVDIRTLFVDGTEDTA